MAGWITTDPFDGIRDNIIQDGHIKAPTQVGIGPDLEGLDVSNGSAELNAENSGRLYQIVCLAGGESIPFRYRLGDPLSTGPDDSQSKFGIFENNTNYPGMALSVVNSTMVSTPMGMVQQMGAVTAPAAGGLYQIGFEAILPPQGAFGNYISDVSITLKPLVDFVASSATVQIPEGQNSFLLVRVNGTVPAGGIAVSLQPSPATPPADFTLGTPVAFFGGSSVPATLVSNGAGGFLLLIPGGTYDGNVGSGNVANPSGAVRIPISTTADTILEDNETYSLTLEPPGTHGSSPIAEWGLGTGAASCWNQGPPPHLHLPAGMATVKIVDDDVDLMATKLVNNAAPEAGGNVAYTVTFRNNTARPTVEPFTAHDAIAAVADAVPPGLAFLMWTCTASGGASCPGGPVNGVISGAGAISGNAVLPAGNGAAGGSVTYTITTAVGAAQCDNVTNTAAISVLPPLQETASGDNSASAAIDPICPAAPVVEVEVEAVSANHFGIAGQNVTLTFMVKNSGNAAADGTQIDNPIPPGLASFTWTCTADGGAVCPNASGTGPISETVGTFPAGGSLTYVVTALVSTPAPPTTINTVTITPSAGGICSGSCTITMEMHVANPIPSLSTIGLLMLAASLAAAGMLLLRR